MQKKISYLILVIMCSFMCLNIVLAKPVYGEYNVEHKLATVEENCEAIFGDPNDKDDLAYFLQQAFNVIKFGGPIIALCLIIYDFVKAITSSDKDALIKAGKNASKRLIFALLLFFIPMLIDAIFVMFGFYGTCGIG